jgi:hypothetical protein
MRPSFEARLAAFPPASRAMAEAARAFLHRELAGLEETVKWGVPVLMRSGRNLFYLNPRPYGADLGFNRGAELPEFAGVFDQVLKQVALVRVRGEVDLRRPGLREAVAAAAEAPGAQGS